jgi:hypothetical protein
LGVTDGIKHRRSKPLAIVERILRNLPIRNPEQWYVDTKSGRLYFGLGKDDTGRYHGIWAFTHGPGVARTIEFAPNQFKALVVKELLEDGCAMLVDMDARGMLREGYSRAR